jgi:hypothetical protein
MNSEQEDKVMLGIALKEVRIELETVDPESLVSPSAVVYNLTEVGESFI